MIGVAGRLRSTADVCSNWWRTAPPYPQEIEG